MDSLVAIASDHAGASYRLEIIKHLQAKGFVVSDLGPKDTTRVDYPDYALQLAEHVAAGKAPFGILICGTGIGMSIVANKVVGIRAALCHNTFTAHATRAHNNANILCLGERVVGLGVALAAVDTFLNTDFEGGRHQQRIDLIDQLDQSQPLSFTPSL